MSELMVTPITLETLWESSIEEHCLATLVPLSLPPLVLAVPLCTCEDKVVLINKRQDLNMALKQLQVVTWVKSQLKQKLQHELHEQDTKETELIARAKKGDE